MDESLDEKLCLLPFQLTDALSLLPYCHVSSSLPSSSSGGVREIGVDEVDVPLPATAVITGILPAGSTYAGLRAHSQGVATATAAAASVPVRSPAAAAAPPVASRGGGGERGEGGGRGGQQEKRAEVVTGRKRQRLIVEVRGGQEGKGGEERKREEGGWDGRGREGRGGEGRGREGREGERKQEGRRGKEGMGTVDLKPSVRTLCRQGGRERGRQPGWHELSSA